MKRADHSSNTGDLLAAMESEEHSEAGEDIIGRGIRLLLESRRAFWPIVAVMTPTAKATTHATMVAR